MTTSEDTTLPVAYLTTARLGEKGQLTLPKTYRDAMTLDTGTPIAILQVGNGLLLIPEHSQFRQLCDRVAATFTSHGIQAQDLLDTLPAARQRVFERQYPQSAAQERPRTRKKRA